MWCKNCNIETNEELCPVCGTKTIEDIPTEVYWCDACEIPVHQEIKQANKGICPLCCKPMKYMAADLRPVFPEERLLLEILLDKAPNEYVEKSVWASNNRYYINGKAISLPSKFFQEMNVDRIVCALEKHKEENTYTYFNNHIARFVKANTEIQSDMVSICLEYVKNKADKIYIYASFEPNVVTSNYFYNIGGNILKKHNLNNANNGFNYDVSIERQRDCLQILIDDIKQLIEVCKKYSRPMPTEIKMVYDVNTKQFNADYKYNLVYSNHKTKTADDIVNDWYYEVSTMDKHTSASVPTHIVLRN